MMQAKHYPLLLAASMLALAGCFAKPSPYTFYRDDEHYRALVQDAQSAAPTIEEDVSLRQTPPPRTLLTTEAPKYRDLTLDEAVRSAMANSKVMHDMGGAVLRSPASARSIHTPALVETDPRFGVENALSAFDPVYSASSNWTHNHRAINNAFLGGGTRVLEQDLAVFQNSLTKLTGDGTQFTLNHNTDYDANNAPANLFPSAWNTNVEAVFNHPFLQGAGVDFNRIAGPTGSPGLFNGVLLARLNTDISLQDFELNVGTLASDVENAYWDLYYSYRDLEAKVAARDSSLETWRRIHALNVAGRRGGEAEKEAQAREQYFSFQEDVQNALSGARANSGQTGSGGVHAAERRLRLLIGLPINDGELLRPSDEPKMTKMVFDWDEIMIEALGRRTELRRQRLTIKRREMELQASKNYLLPTLDAQGLYRIRGFGNKLFGDGSLGQFDNAYGNFFTGQFQEWQAGFNFSAPLGFRKGHALVRNAQLMLARERAVLHEQEREVLHDLSSSIAELDRAYVVAQTSLNRRLAAREQVSILRTAYESDKAPLESLLYTQLRLAEADSHYFRSLTDYALAVKNVHLAKNSILDYNAIYLADALAPQGKARRSVSERVGDRISYVLSHPLRKSPTPAVATQQPSQPPVVESPAVETGKVTPLPPVGDLPPPTNLQTNASPSTPTVPAAPTVPTAPTSARASTSPAAAQGVMIGSTSSRQATTAPPIGPTVAAPSTVPIPSYAPPALTSRPEAAQPTAPARLPVVRTAPAAAPARSKPPVANTPWIPDPPSLNDPSEVAPASLTTAPAARPFMPQPAGDWPPAAGLGTGSAIPSTVAPAAPVSQIFGSPRL